ncbi:MAG: PEP-CTERM sorting domain-containing protein [Chthoniobacterales bacterium]
MNKKDRSRKFTAKQSARLGAYLAAGIGASTVATPVVDAAIVGINIGPSGFNIGGINGGAPVGGFGSFKFNFPISGAGTLNILNNANQGLWGLDGDNGLTFAINGGFTSPRNFALSQSIGVSSYFSGIDAYTGFRGDDWYSVSPNFGPGSYMGFKTVQGNYGWLQVTWTSSSAQFQILSGAYEDQVGVAILAGQGGAPSAVPEPGTWAAAALLAGGATFMRWRRRRDEAQKEAA